MSSRADLQRHEVIPERAHRQRHDRKEHHDRPVHRAERIVKVGRHDAIGRQVAQQHLQQRANKRNRLARMRDLPAHHQHQAKTKQQKAERGEAVLQADDFVVRRKNVFAPEARFLVVRFVRFRVRNCVNGCLHGLILRQFLLHLVQHHHRQQQRQIQDGHEK